MISAAYLRGAISHAIARSRALVEITQSSFALELRDLQRVCTSILNDAIFRLVAALARLEEQPDAVAAIGRIYQSTIETIDAAERFGVFALKNRSDEDIELNRVLYRICLEIGYPILPPTVSHTSQLYFDISPSFNLLRVPLIEGRFLLQLPDLYHELCHPLLESPGITNPKLDPLSTAFLKLKNDRGRALDQARLRGERRRAGPDLAFRYALWRRCWIESWMKEFVCDAFGAFCAGPAYGWTHYHLCYRTGQSVFAVPQATLVSHPDNHARMSVILHVLKNRGFKLEMEALGRAWDEFASSQSRTKSSAFDLCYPPDCLKEIASASTEAFKACGLIGLPIDDQPLVGRALQDAWAMFWSANDDYEAWETDARGMLRTALS